MPHYGKLTLGAVPIGDFKDASLNLIDYIVNHKFILVENVDVFRKLCKDLNIKTDAVVINYGSHDLPEESDKYIDILKNGDDILFLSDEGTAGLIDPGGELMQLARSYGIKVKVMAGANSVIPTVVLARFDKKFLFCGPAQSKEERISYFQEMSSYDFPIVFFVTRDYLEDFFLDAIKFFEPNREVFLCSNLSKEDEFTAFTTLYGAFQYIQSNQINFSTTIVINGKPPH